MGKIIVGVDFSKGSEMAIELAVDIARKFGDVLQFVGVTEGKMPKDELMQEINRRAALNADKLRGVEIEYVVRTGEVTDAICDQAKKEKASLVVVGTQDTAGLQKRLLSPDTYSLVTKSLSPVLFVRENFEFHADFKDILVPIDASDVSRQKVPVAARIAVAFGSTVHLLGVNSSSIEDGCKAVKSYTLQSKSYLEKMGVSCTMEVQDVKESVSATVHSYASKVCADLIVMMAECGMSLIRYVAGSDDQRTLVASKVPIITVHPEQLYTFVVK